MGFCLKKLHNNTTSSLFNGAMSLKAVPQLQHISELNCKKSGFVFVQTILSNASINLMSEYVVALGHYTIPLKLSEVSKAQKMEAHRGVCPLIIAFTELLNAESVFSLLLLGETKT